MLNFFKKIPLVILVLFLMCFCFIGQSYAKKSQRISIIRDDEAELLIKEMLTPLVEVAGQNTKNLRVYIIDDKELNAFVSGGQNIFINSGLITKYKNPDVLMGVIAHELAHIQLGHLVKGYEDYKRSQKIAIIGSVAGIVAAGAGAPEAGQGILMGSNQVAQRSLLKYSRIKEEAADQKAFEFLGAVNMNASGLLEIMNDLAEEERIYDGVNPVEYSSTHPLSSKRISYIKNNIKESKHNNKSFNNKYQYRFDMVRAKFDGYLNGDTPKVLLTKYSYNKAAQAYAVAIMYMERGEFDTALELINKLIKNHPKNPYMYELRGEVYYKQNETDEATADFRRAIELEDKMLLTRVALAQTIYNYQRHCVKVDLEALKEAANNLNHVTEREKDNAYSYYLLAQIYDLKELSGLSYYNLAEYHRLRGRYKTACRYADRAIYELEKVNDGVSLLNAKDLMDSMGDKCSSS